MSLKAAYLEKMETQLREWGAKIDELKAKADQAEAGAKIECMKQLDSLKAKRDAVQTKLGEIKVAGEEAWEILKTGVESAWSELKTAIDGATTKFK
ncbi:MAG: hypothetical protein OEY86_08840 [Nitrospira sp.]|nr:hypothetical protein [Nitrospira sp.]